MWSQNCSNHRESSGSEKLLEDKSAASKLQDNDLSEERFPEKELPVRSRCVRLSMAMRCSRWRRPTRPALARSRVVTRPLTEHDTPCHEHGVEEFVLHPVNNPFGSKSTEDCLKANSHVASLFCKASDLRIKQETMIRRNIGSISESSDETLHTLFLISVES